MGNHAFSADVLRLRPSSPSLQAELMPDISNLTQGRVYSRAESAGLPHVVRLSSKPNEMTCK